MSSTTDSKFLLSLIANLSGGAFDWETIAKECGYGNLQSAKNRLLLIKRRNKSANEASGNDTIDMTKKAVKDGSPIKKKRGRKPKKNVPENLARDVATWE